MRLFGFISLFFLTLNLSAQRHRVIQLDHPDLKTLNFEQDPTVYFETIRDSLIQFFPEEAEIIRVIVECQPKAAPIFLIESSNQLPGGTLSNLRNRLKKIPVPEPQYLPFAYGYTLARKEKNKTRNLILSSSLREEWENLRQTPYEDRSFETNTEQLRSWALDTALQILIAMGERMTYSPPYSGDYFQLLKQATFPSSFSVEQLTSELPLYWETLASNSVNRLLVPLVKSVLLAANGQHSYANNYLHLIYHFSPKNSIFRYFFKEIGWRMTHCYASEQRAITTLKKALPDNQQKIAQALFESAPMNTSILYELLKMRNTLALPKEMQETLYTNFKRSDPVTILTLPPRNATEYYTNAIRTEMENLHILPEAFPKNFPTYAEMALKLDANAFAADIYTQLKGYSQTETLDYENDLEFALFRLGVKENLSRKKMRTFKRRAKRMEKQQHKAIRAVSFTP